MGTNDLAKELRAALVPGRAPLLPHLATALLGAREAGKAIVDGVYNDVRTSRASRRSAARAPSSASTARRSSTRRRSSRPTGCGRPTEDEVARARAVVDAFAQAEREGRGVVIVDGRMMREPARRQRPAHARARRGGRGPGLTAPADQALLAGDTPHAAASAA